MRESQQFQIEESISLAYEIYKEFPPSAVFQMIEEENNQVQLTTSVTDSSDANMGLKGNKDNQKKKRS